MSTATANISNFLCRIKCDSCFGQGPLSTIPHTLFAINESTTVSELHQMIQTSLRKPTEDFTIGSGLRWILSGKGHIFPLWKQQASDILDLQLHPYGRNLRIYVKTKTSKTLTLDLSSKQSIDDMKSMYEQKEGVPVNQQRLLFAGKQLEDGKYYRYLFNPSVTH